MQLVENDPLLATENVDVGVGSGNIRTGNTICFYTSFLCNKMLQELSSGWLGLSPEPHWRIQLTAFPHAPYLVRRELAAPLPKNPTQFLPHYFLTNQTPLPSHPLLSLALYFSLSLPHIVKLGSLGDRCDPPPSADPGRARPTNDFCRIFRFLLKFQLKVKCLTTAVLFKFLVN